MIRVVKLAFTVLFLFPLVCGLQAADVFRTLYDRTVITDIVVFQQPSENARGVQFTKLEIQCGDGTSACEVTVYRDGPAMTCSVPANCELTPVPVITSTAVPRFKVYYTASSTTGAASLGFTKFFNYMPFDVEDMKLARNGTNINYYIKLVSTSGIAVRWIINSAVTQE